MPAVPHPPHHRLHGRRRWLQALAAVAAPLPRRAGAAPRRVRVALFPDLDRGVIAALPRWRQLHPDIEVQLVPLQYADHHNAMTTALATGSGLPDVMAMDLRFVGKFTAGRGLLDLNQPPFSAGTLAAGFVPYSWQQGRTPRGEQVGIPVDIGPGTLLYRRDLVQQAGLDEADLTGSWERFIASGVRLRRGDGPFLLADSGDLRDMILRGGVQPGAGLYFDAEGRPAMRSARFERAFELGRQAHVAGICANVTAWANDWVIGLRRGRIAAQMMGAWLAGHLKNWLAPDSAGHWRAAPLPDGLFASYGGSFYGIPAKASDPQAAWAFIRFMTADPVTQLGSLRHMDGFPSLLAAQRDPVFDEPLPYLGGQPARQMWRDTAARVPPVAVHALDAMATEVMRAEYVRVIYQGKPVGRALADAQALVEHRLRR